VVAHDDFLRQPLGDIGSAATGILADELDLGLSGAVAALFHVEFDAVIHLRGSVGKLAGIGHDEADFHGFLSIGCGRA